MLGISFLGYWFHRFNAFDSWHFFYRHHFPSFNAFDSWHFAFIDLEQVWQDAKTQRLHISLLYFLFSRLQVVDVQTYKTVVYVKRLYVRATATVVPCLFSLLKISLMEVMIFNEMIRRRLIIQIPHIEKKKRSQWDRLNPGTLVVFVLDNGSYFLRLSESMLAVYPPVISGKQYYNLRTIPKCAFCSRGEQY